MLKKKMLLRRAGRSARGWKQGTGSFPPAFPVAVLAIATALVATTLLAGCAGGGQEAAPTEQPGAGAPSEGAPAVLLGDPAPNDDGEIRVLVYHDMEGLSGQDDWRTFDYGHPQFYSRGRQLLTGDVNAVVDGLFAGGADVVHVVDAHGSGSPEPDLLLDQLDSRAQPVFRDVPFRPYVDLTEEGAYDAVAVVGMHAKTGAGGFAAHTFTLGMDWILNGRSITETEIIGFSWGRVDVPVIFASGDDRLQANLETMPWLEYVVTKHATSASTAELRAVDEVHAEMREAAQRALELRDRARVMKLSEPVTARLRAVPPADLSILAGVPGVGYEGQTVTFEAADFQTAYDGITGLIRVGAAAYTRVLTETLRELPDGEHLLTLYDERLVGRWLDFESGRWAPPERGSRATGRRYHGAR